MSDMFQMQKQSQQQRHESGTFGTKHGALQSTSGSLLFTPLGLNLVPLCILLSVTFPPLTQGCKSKLNDKGPEESNNGKKKKKKKSAMDEMGMGNIVMYYKVRKEVWVKPTQHNTQ